MRGLVRTEAKCWLLKQDGKPEEGAALKGRSPQALETWEDAGTFHACHEVPEATGKR